MYCRTRPFVTPLVSSVRFPGPGHSRTIVSANLEDLFLVLAWGWVPLKLPCLSPQALKLKIKTSLMLNVPASHMFPPETSCAQA